MKDFLWSVFCALNFVGGFMFCFWMLKKAKEKLLDVPKGSVTVQDIAEWVKRKRESDALFSAAREMIRKSS